MRLKSERKVVEDMKHIPFGYEIIGGRAVINAQKAEKITLLFKHYLEGESLERSAESSSIGLTHSQIGRILEKRIYCGDDFYPQIIPPETFEKAQVERVKRATKLGRLNKSKPLPLMKVQARFRMKNSAVKFDDPFKQAEYLYSMIESER